MKKRKKFVITKNGIDIDIMYAHTKEEAIELFLNPYDFSAEEINDENG